MFTSIPEGTRKHTLAIKSALFKYDAPEELSSLFEDFRLMCNEAIKVTLQEKPGNRFKLLEMAYERLKKYGLHTHYILSACEVAFSVCKNRRKWATPYIKRPFLKLDNQSYRLKHLLLRIPTAPRRFVFLTLRGSDHHISIVDDLSLKKGTVTITPEAVIIPFSKEAEVLEPMGFLGVDVNERNATVSGTDGWHRRFNELGDVVEIKERYREIRAGISHKTRGDRRTAKRLLEKYGRREKERTVSRINKITRSIVDYAKSKKLGIKLENLKGIGKLYRRGNNQSRSFRGRMNTWVFGETHRQVDYKSKWDGVPLWYVNPRGTSSYCLCGSRVAPLADRKSYCPKCDKSWDRDDLASKRIMACAVPQDRPSRGSREEERGDDSNLLSRWREG